MAYGSRWQIHYCFVHSSKQSKCCCGEWAVTGPAPRQHHAININKSEAVRSPRGKRRRVTWIRSVANKFGERGASFLLHSCTNQTVLQGGGKGHEQQQQLPVIRRLLINGQKMHKYLHLQSSSAGSLTLTGAKAFYCVLFLIDQHSCEGRLLLSLRKLNIKN